MIRLTILSMLLLLIMACGTKTDALTAKQSAEVQDSVQLLTESIASHISSEGPVAWLRYFEDSPGFIMASEGRLVFPNNDSATRFIKNELVKSISKIELHWSNMRIDPLTARLACIGATFHEDITFTSGIKQPTDGYFTAVAHQTPQGWQLHNAHWSILPSH